MNDESKFLRKNVCMLLPMRLFFEHHNKTIAFARRQLHISMIAWLQVFMASPTVRKGKILTFGDKWKNLVFLQSWQTKDQNGRICSMRIILLFFRLRFHLLVFNSFTGILIRSERKRCILVSHSDSIPFFIDFCNEIGKWCCAKCSNICLFDCFPLSRVNQCRQKVVNTIKVRWHIQYTPHRCAAFIKIKMFCGKFPW